jgi:ribose-phosphate pyrophosphokinase
MLSINLHNPKESVIAFREGQFPDSQRYIHIRDSYSIATESEIGIIVSLSSFNELERLLYATAALREIFTGKIHVFITYFLGARSDRRFLYKGEFVDTNYLKNIICPIINAQKYNKVYVLDPHSDVLEACLDNFYKVSPIQFVQWAVNEITKSSVKKTCMATALVSPDAGAEKKVASYMQPVGLQHLIVASKVRDVATGNIIATRLPELPGVADTFIIVDDICDGGRTFIELAKAIKLNFEDKYPESSAKIYLIVTHGIFSAGFQELDKYISGIYCTDSLGLDLKTYPAESNLFSIDKFSLSLNINSI